MLWKKYHRNYITQFKKGDKFKLSYYKRDPDTFALEKITGELQILKKPYYIDIDQQIYIDIDILGDRKFSFAIVYSNGTVRWKEPIQIC